MQAHRTGRMVVCELLKAQRCGERQIDGEREGGRGIWTVVPACFRHTSVPSVQELFPQERSIRYKVTSEGYTR